MPRFVEVAKKSQIPENGAIGVEVQGKRLALMNLSGEIYASSAKNPRSIRLYRDHTPRRLQVA